MNALVALLRSSIGRKVVMAVTGVVLFGFVLGHMAGNLQAFVGPTKLDAYGAALRRVPALLWTVRLGLLGAGAEVVSGGELKRVLAAGVSPKKIMFSGIGKTAAELTLAVDEDILCVNVESEPELDLLSQVASA